MRRRLRPRGFGEVEVRVIRVSFRGVSRSFLLRPGEIVATSGTYVIAVPSLAALKVGDKIQVNRVNGETETGTIVGIGRLRRSQGSAGGRRPGMPIGPKRKSPYWGPRRPRRPGTTESAKVITIDTDPKPGNPPKGGRPGR